MHFALVWQHQLMFKDAIVRLGVFHTVCSHLGAVGKWQWIRRHCHRVRFVPAGQLNTCHLQALHQSNACAHNDPRSTGTTAVRQIQTSKRRTVLGRDC